MPVCIGLVIYIIKRKELFIMNQPPIKKNTRLFVLLGMLLPIMALACQVAVPTAEPITPTTPPQEVLVVEPTPVMVSASPEVVSEEALIIDLYKRVNPSVVNVTVYGEQSGQVIPIGQGSGFVIDNDGRILTNAHVVHGSQSVEVTFANGLTREAEILGEDLHSDLAVVKVDLPEGVGSLPLGSMENLAVGQTALAIGNPFGMEGTLTKGIISALGRTIPALTVFSIPQSIQTDAPINPGNSGGPLFNLDGEVIGVNAQIETDGTNRSNSGVGYAIPVSIVKLVVPSLIEHGEYDWPWLGVVGGDVTPSLVEAMDLPVEQGAYFSEITEGGPAEGAGLLGATGRDTIDGRLVLAGGDVVTAIDGQPVLSFDDLLLYIALKTSPDQQVTLTILRAGEYQDVDVKLAERPGQ
jgi:2-alkenal reductase